MVYQFSGGTVSSVLTILISITSSLRYAVGFGQHSMSNSAATVPDVYSRYVKQMDNDAFNVIFENHVNSWTQIRQLNSTGSHIVEGDVTIDSRSGLNILAYPPNREDRMIFRDWLREVGYTGKGVKINLLKSTVVGPALRDLFAKKDFLTGPIWLHANIVRGPNHELDPTRAVDPRAFVRDCSDIFPWATVSVGWVSQWTAGSATQEDRYTWRHILDMLDHTMKLKQPVNFVIRDVFVRKSLTQILWLLSVRPEFSITITFPDLSYLDDFAGVVALRKYGDIRRLFYNFESGGTRHAFSARSQSMYSGLSLESLTGRSYLDSGFNRTRWRAIDFDSADPELSAAIVGRSGVAFVGKAQSFILSKERFPTYHYLRQQEHQRLLATERRQRHTDANSGMNTGTRRGEASAEGHDTNPEVVQRRLEESKLGRKRQRVKGRVLFIPRRPTPTQKYNWYSTDSESNGANTYLGGSTGQPTDRETGIAIYLLPDAHDFGSPEIQGGIEIFLSITGYMQIADQTSTRTRARQRISASQTSVAPCYWFDVLDAGTEIIFTVEATSTCVGVEPYLEKGRREFDSGPRWRKDISLPVAPPANTSQGERYVIVKKVGQSSVDLYVDELIHVAAARSVVPWVVPMIVTLVLTILV